jgi:hypothetical protein
VRPCEPDVLNQELSLRDALERRGAQLDRTGRWTLPVRDTLLAVRFKSSKRRVSEVVISVPLVPLTKEDARGSSGVVLDEIELHEVGAFDRFLRQRDLGYRPSMGDPELDDQFELVSAAEEGEIRRFFQRKPVRDAILQLFAHQHGSLYIRESIVFRTPFASVEPDVLDTMLDLRAALSHVSEVRRRSRVPEVAALCVTLPAFVGGCLALSHARSAWGPLPEQLLNVGAKLGGIAIIGALAGAITGYLTGRLIRARPRLTITLLGLCIFAASLLAMTGLLVLNGTADATTRWHSTEIVEMAKRSRKGGGASRILRLAPWGPATRPIEILVGQRIYHRSHVGAETLVRTGDGALGIAWRDRHGVQVRPAPGEDLDETRSEQVRSPVAPESLRSVPTSPPPRHDGAHGSRAHDP